MSQAENTCSLCPEGWVSFQSKCYFFSTDLLDWQSSQEKCMSMCGHLVIVESAEEQNFLENKTKDFNDGGYWIGLTDQKNENTFVWVNNRPLDSNNRFWDKEEPSGKRDENCVQIWRTNQQKRWHDYPCGTVAKRVCETTAFLLYN
ncbi:C-type lectin domain family 4 member E-like [Polypterus senegalus]|uniref:C-type lectin domain family 4 member E-like n=1 Tax=Polypterus senegalus TaxID=55291 RepID=UPI0019640007|nr:C-type lectin domain family 4 member E-like [Polypterus senegalus]